MGGRSRVCHSGHDEVETAAAGAGYEIVYLWSAADGVGDEESDGESGLREG